jgi:putative ABC transport system permease protein
MFFLSGVSMILAATFLLVYNADLMLGALTWAGGAFSSLIPSIRTAVAYPLANKFRTGMTIAMISLVMFALVMMSTMNSNFSRIFLGDEPLGGYQIVVTENPNNHIGNVKQALLDQGGDAAAAASTITEEDPVRLANQRVAQVRNEPKPGATEDDLKFENYTVVGPSTNFIENNGVKLDARAEGYGSDQDVWRALESDPSAAVIDSNALSGGGGFSDSQFKLDGVKQGDKTFKPITVQVRDATAPDKVVSVHVIGVIGTKASALFGGLYLAPPTFDDVYTRPESSLYAIKIEPGTNAVQTAKTIEKSLSSRGVQAESLRKIVDDFQAANQGFLYLIQGFMGIGLFVGIAAVGVIAFRTVVERRQQIGMLRAIGYSRRAIAISFIMESSFVALLGVLSGITLALLLAYQLLSSDEVGNAGVDGFYIPWLQIGLIGGFAFLASLLMTIIPSRQASSIPIAEALRYE